MEGSIECFNTLICSGARRLTGYQRRLEMSAKYWTHPKH